MCTTAMMSIPTLPWRWTTCRRCFTSAWPCFCTTWESQRPSPWKPMVRGIFTAMPPQHSAGGRNPGPPAVSPADLPAGGPTGALPRCRAGGKSPADPPLAESVGAPGLSGFAGSSAGRCGRVAPAYCTRNHRLNSLEKQAKEILAEKPCLTTKELSVNGKDLLALGYRGPALGVALRRLLDQVLEGALPNEKQALLQWLVQNDTKKIPGKQRQCIRGTGRNQRKNVCP